jgi:hypothetical protein
VTTAERARRRLLVFAVVVAAGFGALAVLSWWMGRDNPREGSKVVAQSGEPLRITSVPQSYRIVYRIDDRAGSQIVTTTERAWFRRPFQSRIETYSGPPPGDSRRSVRQSGFGVLASVNPNSAPLNIVAPPSLASGDLRVDTVLRDAVADRTIIVRERREVFGRLCQVYRAGGPVFAGDLERYVPRSGNFADICVDRSGIVIEEAWTFKGRLIRRRAAVEVRINPPIDRKLFEIEAPPSEEISRGAIQRLDENRKVPGLYVLPDTPKGFRFLGRYGIVIPSAALPNPGGGVTPGPGPSSTSDVYVRGPDVLVVDQDPSLVRIVQQESRDARAIKLPNLRDAKLIVDARMSEIRGQVGDSVVRIFGTIPPSELMKLARQLKPLG